MRRIHAVSAIITLLLSAMTACTSDQADDGGSRDPVVHEFAAPTKKQLARGVRLGDQTNQALNAVAARGKTVVAVGWEDAANLTRALFLVSTDGGASWQRGDVDAESIPDDLGDSGAYDVTWGADGFVAIGWRGDGRPAVWASKDGVRWQLNEQPPATFGTGDDLDAITWSQGTYFVAGTNEKKVGSATDRVVVWRSRDATTWRRVDLAQTLRGVQGTPSVDDIAVLDKQVLVAGGIEDITADQPDRLAMWLSTNRGRSFGLAPTAPDLGGGYRAYSQAITTHDGSFHAAASGDGLSDTLHGESSWDPVVVRHGSDGWTTHVDAATSSRAEEHPSTIFRSQGRWVVATQASLDSDVDAGIYVGADYSAMTKVTAPTLAGRAPQEINDGVAVKDHAILVGSDARSGSTEPAIWRLEGARASRVSLPRSLSAGDPSVAISELVSVGDRFVAAGTVAQSPVVCSGDGDRWQAEGLEGRSDSVPELVMSDAAVVGRGRVVAVGQQARGLGTDAVLWVRGRKGKWQSLWSPVLRNRSEGGYGSLAPKAIGVAGREVVVAVDRYINGRSEIAPFYSRDGGRTWSASTSLNFVHPSENDEFFGRTKWREFRAPENGTVTTTNVAKGSRGWLLAGNVQRSGEGERPAIWRSDDGSTWGALKRLPLPKGAYGAVLSALAVRGKQIVATGRVTRSASDQQPSWVSWVSTNGGKSWRLGVPVADRATAAADLVRLEDGHLVVGSTGPPTSRDVAAWTSADGLTWQEVDLGVVHAEGAGSQSVTQAVIHGERLHLIGFDRPPQGGVVWFESVPIPEVR